MKGLGESAYDGEAELAPKLYCTVITGRHEIESHGLVPKLSCEVLGVFAHRGSEATSSGR